MHFPIVQFDVQVNRTQLCRYYRTHHAQSVDARYFKRQSLPSSQASFQSLLRLRQATFRKLHTTVSTALCLSGGNPTRAASPRNRDKSVLCIAAASLGVVASAATFAIWLTSSRSRAP